MENYHEASHWQSGSIGIQWSSMKRLDAFNLLGLTQSITDVSFPGLTTLLTSFSQQNLIVSVTSLLNLHCWALITIWFCMTISLKCRRCLMLLSRAKWCSTKLIFHKMSRVLGHVDWGHVDCCTLFLRKVHHPMHNEKLEKLPTLVI